MPKITRESSWLSAYLFHGLELTPVSGGGQGQCDCPWCGREDRFYVNADTTQWDCKKCGDSGNLTTFLRRLHEVSRESTADDDLVAFAKKRRLISADTLVRWGVCRSALSGEWLIPGYGIDGQVNQLYRYAPVPGSSRWALLGTPGVQHQLMGPFPLKGRKEYAYLCEGPWDGMALEECMRSAKGGDDGSLSFTGNPRASLAGDAVVLATPSCNVFRDKWLSLFSGRSVSLLFDSDHPAVNQRTGQAQSPAGWLGMRRVAELLCLAPEPPADIHVIRWGPDGYDPGKPAGYDVRDALTFPPTMPARVKCLESLLDLVQPMPPEWGGPRTGQARREGKADVQLVPCSSWSDLVLSWRKALKWTEGLERALAVMLSCVLSTGMVGESQLWAIVTGPPSSGKTTLCEALSTARQYVHAKSELTRLYSGYKADREGSEDFSLMAKLNGKTLVVKDADPLLKSPQRSLILGQLRDVYDGATRSHFNNGTARDYRDIRCTMIICGTSALRELDAAELGARFVYVSIMDFIDPEFEKDVNRRVVFRALRDVKCVANGRADPNVSEDMALARATTGGYVTYLRENSAELMSRVVVTEDQAERIIALGTFVAYMRARPSKKQDEVVEREFSSRLVEQYARLTSCLAAVTGRFVVDEVVMRWVTRVALDTARGRTLRLIEVLYQHGEHGLDLGALAHLVGEELDDVKKIMLYMRKIKVVTVAGKHRPLRYRLTPRMLGLYRQVVDGGS